MRWVSAVSDAASLTEAVDQASEQALADPGLAAPDLVFAFVSPQHAPSYHSVPELIASRLGAAVVIGCSGGGVIGGGREVERRPGVALCAASMPGVSVVPFHVQQEEIPSADAPPEAWEALIGVAAGERPAIVVLADPFSIRTDALVAGLDYAYPGSVKTGGLVSGGNRATPGALFINDRVVRSGAVGVALSGDIEVDTIVAQGCRPIGRPAVITECRGNAIRKLDGEKPLLVLQRVFEEAEESERRLLGRALHIGIVMDPLAERFAAGDFLIRNVIGLDEASGSISVGENVREGQVVQFHVREAATAREDLRAVLERYVSEDARPMPDGGLLFSCVGRGEGLFGEPDHDSTLFRSMVSPIPLAGFFGNGEIGPVGGTTFLHGYTSSFALFRRRRAARSPSGGEDATV